MNRRKFIESVLIFGAGVSTGLLISPRTAEVAPKIVLKEKNPTVVIKNQSFVEKKIIFQPDVIFENCQFHGCYFLTKFIPQGIAGLFHSNFRGCVFNYNIFEHSEVIWNQNQNKTCLEVWQQMHSGKNA